MDAFGEQVVNYTYDAWGKPLTCTGSMVGTVGTKNPFRYRGYYYDTESGLYYLNSRYYDPEVGRFVNADDFELITASLSSLSDKNLYAYCDDTPVMCIDENGEVWGLTIGMAIFGAVTNAATTTLSAAMCGVSGLVNKGRIVAG